MESINKSVTSSSLDVWLRFNDNYDTELAEYEANTFMTVTGYLIEYYHNDVGQVSSVEFDTLADAYAWYEENGFEDFSS